MPLDVQNTLNAVVQVLRDNTATFAASLTSATAIVTVREGDARSAPLTIGEYPAVLVQLVREDEEFSQVGQRLNKHVLEYAIVPMVYQGISAVVSDRDVRTMTKNIKGILKTNITLSATALISMPESVDYFAPEINGIYCSASLITFKAEYLST